MKNTFNMIYIYTKNKAEPLYEFLESKIDPEFLQIHEGLDNLKSTQDSDYFGQTLMIFDDLCLEKDQLCIGQMYIRGRKLQGGISLCYLSQSYFEVPTIIRGQSQYIFLKKIPNKRNLKAMLREYSLNTTIEQILAMYSYCIDGDFLNFLLIDLENPESNYRKGFNEILDHTMF
jgi:hypothetical protein